MTFKPADLINQVVEGANAADVLEINMAGAVKQNMDSIVHTMEMISKYSTNIPGFLNAAASRAHGIKDIPDLFKTIKQAEKLAKQMDQLVGKALILAGGGDYK